MKEDKIKILVIRHNEEPEVVEIENYYKAMQEIVEGLIEFMPFDKSNPGCECLVNEEYLLLQDELGFNRFVQSDYHSVVDGTALIFGVPVFGTFAIVRVNHETGECISLTDKDIARYTEKFKL